MANDANVFKSGLTSAGYVTPTEWARQIEQVAREANIMLGLEEAVVEYDMVDQAGNTLNIQKNSALSASDVTDGNSVDVSSLTFSQISVSASIRGTAVQITLKQLRDQLPTVRQDVISNLGLSLAEKKEADMISEAENTSSTVIYADDVDSSTISDSNQFDTDLFISGRTAMRKDKREPRYLVIHPDQEGNLINDNKFLDASQFGSTQANREGFIGRYLGTDVFVSTNIGSVTENGTTVYKALLLGRRALAHLIKNRPTIDMDRNNVEDLSMTFVAHEDYGVKVLNDESIRILKSA